MYNFNIMLNNYYMFTLIVRSIIIYVILFLVIRIMGKRQIAEMQPFELVITLIIADLACVPMGSTTTPIADGIVPLLTLVVLHYLMSLLSRKSIKIRKFINGKPIILINEKGINYDSLKRLNMTLNDLNEILRNEGHFNFGEVAFAVMETNGTISILPKSTNSPATCEQLKIETYPASLNVMLINDGKIIKENLDYLKINQDFIFDILKKQSASLKDTIILSIDDFGKVYFQAKGKNAKTFNTSFERGNK